MAALAGVTHPPLPGVAIVVPVLRDTAAVRRLFESIETWPSQPQELVVVTGEADAELGAACRDYGYRCIEAPAVRGAQLDVGAKASSAPILWFLHADAAVPANGIDAVASAVADGAESGCFTFSFQGRPNLTKKILALAVRLRVRCRGIPYGDQGLFATRAAYEECGGFPHQPLFEEVRLVRRLRQRGTFALLVERIAVSTRRWDRDGWWRRTLHNRWLALCFMLGVSPERLAGSYGPISRRSTDERRSAT